jgi:cellulose synthase/poly-beta-1,6-N-acetylglucosamine synthase-like glycosyltransferase
MKLIDLTYLFIFGSIIFSSSLWILLYFFNRNKVNSDPEPSIYPSVTFLVPAYNEEEYVEECLDSLLGQDYPSDKLEIIAINDGSTDRTLEKIKNYKDRIQIIDKENSGKASSLNYALKKVDTEIVGCMDADSFPEKDFVKNMVGYFDQEDVKGVTPAMKVLDPQTWPQKIMWAEFVYNVLLRKMFSIFDSQWVMPGPGSLYDAEYLRELGGWDEETLTEDMEIAFRMFKHGAKLKNSTNAYVDTLSPPTLKGLFKQRMRWYRGYINNALRYSELWFNPKYGNLGVIVIPFNAFWTLLMFFMVGHMMFRVVSSGVQMVQTYMLAGFIDLGVNFSVQSLSMFHLFYGLLGIGGIGLLYLSLKVAEEKLKLWERKVHYGLFLLVYGPLYVALWVAAIIGEIKGDKDLW